MFVRKCRMPVTWISSDLNMVHESHEPNKAKQQQTALVLAALTTDSLEKPVVSEAKDLCSGLAKHIMKESEKPRNTMCLDDDSR